MNSQCAKHQLMKTSIHFSYNQVVPNIDNNLIQQYYKEHINSGLFGLLSFMGLDVAEVSADGWTVKATDGREFIDCVGGYGAYNFGHRHPRIVDAVKRQLDIMPMPSKLLLNPVQAEAAAKLAEMTPGGLQYTFFSNSGTEAVEAALKLARLSTGKPGIISAKNAFHGKTFGALSSTHKEKLQAPFGPLVGNFNPVPFGDVDAMRDAISDDTAAVMLEPIQGEGGIVIPPSGYLATVRKLTADNGVLLIADEVQTGVGRTGVNFACQYDGICPDIMVLAKSLGGGVMPVGATIGTTEVWEVFQENPLLHTSTFGGNGLACAAMLEALCVLEEEDVAAQAKAAGEYFLSGLRALADAYPDLVKEARGRGLLLGMEMTSSDASELFIASVIDQQVLVAFALNQPGVIRIEPPLIMPIEVIDTVLERLKLALEATRAIFSQYESSIGDN